MLTNKVVLCFESEFSTKEEGSWLKTYNQKSVIHLTLFHELPNALLVVQFEAVDLGSVKRFLLAASPIHAGELGE